MHSQATPETGSVTRAAVLVMLGMFIIGLIDNFVVFIAAHSGLWQFHFMRSAMAVPLIALIAARRGVSLWPERPARVAVRSVLMATSMMLYFGAIPLLPISAVVAGLFTAPAFVLIFSVLFFGVRVGWVRVLAVAIGFFGVFLVLDPDPASLRPVLAVPVLAGVFYALNSLTIRHWCANEDTLTLLAWFFGAMGIAGLIGAILLPGDGAEFALRGWVAPGPVLFAWCAVQAVGSILGVGCLTRAYQESDPSFVSVFEYSLLIFATFWALVLFGVAPGWLALAGIGLILLSGLTIVLRSR